MSVPDANSHAPIHRGHYLGLMLGAICLGVGCAIGVVMLMNGSVATGQWAAISLTIAALPTLLPGLLHVRPANWGTLVFASSTLRMFMLMAIGYMVSTGQDLERKPFWFGLLAGAMLVLGVESVVATMALARRERERHNTSSPGATPAGLPRTTP